MLVMIPIIIYVIMGNYDKFWKSILSSRSFKYLNYLRAETHPEMAWRACLFVFLIVFNYIEPGSSALSKASMQSTKMMMKNLCKGKSKVSQDVLNQLKTGVFVDDKKLKCYIHCCLGMMKTMKKDKLTIADAKKQIELLLPDDMKEASLKQLDACKDTVGANACDTAFNFAKCCFEVEPNNMLIPT